ncbi:isopeptide-forming domain-containing fimbrial protein [Streptococcus ruminantium]|uniref:isopeptide-forming domain-containing fimbrial protein n=3 Tax=Streptococcus ruminantium TaxID=1917441 RepID=UPI001F02BF46|nr:isopeptide-forming domain-containing fimbrial protein [Streptococcus ruminantium]BDD41815.1 hypothetical protein GUT189_01480 [Streptococcus ruminantium]
MKKKLKKKKTKGLIGLIGTMTILFPLLLNLALGLSASATGLGNVVNSQTINTKATQEGCAIKIETTEKVEWKMPRQPVDLVIIQDASGSFEETMPKIKEALKRVTETTTEKAYDEKNPKLVFTDNPDTTDRVMVTSYAGLDVARQYDDDAFIDDYGRVRGTDSNFKVLAREVPQTKDLYRFDTNGKLLSSTEAINAEVEKIKTGGGTPTVPAIEDAIKKYEAVKGNMTNGRKTVFLLVTDGIANGYRVGNKVYIDRSMYRTYKLMNDWDTGYRMPEAAQNYLARAKELEEAGAKLKAAAGENGKVVVGFWEDKAKLQAFDTGFGYLYAYDNAFGTPESRTTITTGDNRSIREVFTTALKSVASASDVLPTGEAANYYVEDTKIDQFAAKILKSITAAITKEDVSGNFTVTEGYKVESVTINKKKVVSEVKNPETEIRGTVKQDGRTVTITVPDSVFNPGNNDFNYELKRTEEAENLSEADEKEPPADYKPSKVNREVGQLVGKFKVGEFESAEIGSKDPVTVEVTDLKYCYPRVTKDVKDTDESNDTNGDDGKTGYIKEDPLLLAGDPSISRPTYAATLSDQGESFTYKVRYDLYNLPLEMKQNVMLVDRLDYRISHQDAYVTDTQGKRLDEFKIFAKEVKDEKENLTTLIYATVPESPGTNTDTMKEGRYGGHKFKSYNLVIKAKIKDEYTFEKNETVYKSMMTENGGLGFMNQARIVWNGTTAEPEDSTGKVRRSNAVYVVPPVKTDITKKVSQTIKDNGEEHLELPTRLDEYYYQINSTWPGLFDNYIIEDVLVPELMSLNDAGEDKVFVNGKESTTLTKYLKKETVEVAGEKRDRVFFELDATKLSKLTLRRINTEIENLNKGNSNPPVITLGIKARIRNGSVLAHYADNNGKILVPNTAKVTLNGTPKESNKVTVSPNSPAAAKRINKDKESLVTGIDPDSGEGEIFEYDVFATLPNDINQAHEYVIKDVIDERLELINFDKLNAPVRMVDVDAEHFDVEVKKEDVDGKQQNVVYSRMKSTSFKNVKAGDVVHMVIRARVKKGATGTIENTATVYYNEKPTPPTPPVTVTPTPPAEKQVQPTVMSREAGEADGVPQGTYTAKINKPGEDIEIAVWNDPYVYTVKSIVPKGAYTFTIEDAVIPEMEIENTINDTYPRKVEITTDNGIVTIPAEQVKVDKQNLNKQTISVTLTEEQIKEYAEKPIVLTFTAKFKAGASLTEYLDQASGLPKAPNTATIQVDNKPKVKSNTVTVTPPINEPEIKKKVQDKEHHDLTGRYELFKYSIQTTMPYNAKDFTVSDILEPVLHLASPIEQITVKVGDHTYTGDDLKEIIKVTEEEIDGAMHPVVTASFVEKHIKNNESKMVLIEFLAQVNNEADLTKYRYVKENHSEKYGDDTNHAEIPNVASYKIGNRIRKESNKVTVTPPPPTPSKITKKIEDVYSKTDPKPLVDHLNVENEKDYNYVVDTVLPSNIFEYKSWRMEDTLDPRLELSKKEQPFIVAVHDDGQPATEEDQKYIDDHFKLSIVDVSVNGQPTKKIIVTVPENKMKTLHDKYHLRLYIPAHIKAGVKDKRIPNEAVKIGVKPNNEEHILSTPPVTVTPPDETPTPEKTVDDQESLNLASLGQEFTYRVKVTVPENIVGMTKFEISDDLEDILTVTDTAVTVDGQGDEKVSVTSINDANAANGKVIAALPTDKISTYKGKEIILVIKARIKNGVKASELAKYVSATNQDGSIPNKATLTVGDKPEQKKDSNEVPVTPPGEEPNVSKKINETEDNAVVLPESDYRYNIKSTLPKDISTYKKFVIVDDVDSRLAIQGIPVIKGEAADFFTVKVTGQTVTAKINDFVKAKAFAGEAIELVITAQVKKGATLIEGETGIPNTSKVTYQNKSHVDGTPDSETPPTPPVTVTPPPVTKKINETLDHLDTATKTNYNYNIKTVLPSDIASYKTFVINDDLDKDLEVQGTPIIKGDAAKFFKVTVDGQKVRATITDFNAAKAYAGKEVELVIVSQIREGVTRQAIPNQTTITYTNKVKAGGEPGDTTTTPPTPPVTVTPPGETPTVEKKINKDLTEATVLPESNYTYNITSLLPVDITRYKAYAIVDELDENLAIQGTPVMAKIDGVDMTQFFDVKVAGQKVTATMKNFENAKDLAGKKVELVITAQVKSTSKAPKIDNTAKVTYQNKSHVDGTPDSETPPTPPVTVTPPPVTKKINETLDHLDTATKTNYNYNIKTVLPSDIASYKTFVINDDLDKDLEVQGTPIIKGDAAKFFKVTVDGQKVRATITDFNAAKAYAGKEVELVIVSQIREGVTRQAIPNQTTITYTNKVKAGGEPGDTTTTPPTPPVTVTPPGETPTVEKKINKDLTEATVLPESNYTYNITSLLPVDITRYKAYAIVDELDENLAIQGTPVMAKIDSVDMTQFFDVKVTGQKVTATMKNFKDAAALAGKKVELVITAQVKSTSKAPKIDNTAKVTYQNKSHVDGTPDSETPPTPPVTVTPPPVTKKINETLDHLDTATKTNYNYNIKTVLPSDIASYKTFVINDDLDKDLEVQGTPIIKDDAAKFFKVTVDGQKVRATITDFNAAKAYAGKEVELVIVSQIREGVTRQAIPNQTTITYTNKVKVGGEPGDTTTTPPTPPVTVTPPGETPTVEKKINNTLDHLDVDTEKDYTYNLTTTLPVDITSYKKFVIVDVLDKDLAVQGTPTITGEAAKFFDVKVDGQTVTATMKDFKNAKDLAGKKVELVIVSQIREGVTRQAIPNTAKVTYQNKSHVDGTPDSETPPTPPVTVTPPGEDPTVEKKINNTLDHLDVDTEKDYTYNLTTTLPVDITSYKKFAIVDVLDKDLAVQGTPTITGEAAKFFDVKVDGQTVTATMKDFKNAKDLAGKKVELVIVSQVREGVTRQAIPNTAKVEFTNKAGQVGEKETKPVTVTPPTPNTPPIEKKVNGAESADLASRQEVFTYTIDTIVPTGAFAFEVSDTLKDVLTFEGAMTATLSGKSIAQSQISIDGQTVTVKLTKQQVREQAGKPLHIEFSAKVKDGVDLTPYMTNGKTSIPNTANYIVNNDPATKKDSNTVPVYPPTPNEPGIDKKINRDLTHLNVEVNKSYMYNVTANLPQDIATYREFVITDTLESVLAINGDVVAYVDGYATDAVKVTVEGNRVVATVVDFAKLAGFKQIQLYIPAYIKSDADLTAYVTNNVASIPNTASLEFTDSNGVKKRKDTTPVTVTPPTPDTPPTPPVNPPQPGTPVKTVSRVEGLEQTNYLALLQATESFRFDIKSVVPTDEAEDRRLNLTSITITDQLDPLFTVDKAKVAVKLTNAPTSNANYIDEDVEKAQAELDAEKAKLEEIKKSSQTEASAAALSEAQKVVARLETELAEAQAKLTELKTSATSATTESSSSTEVSAVNPVDVIATDHSSEIAAQEVVIAELQAKLEAAKQRVQVAQEVLAKAKTPSEVKVEADNQEKVVAAKQKVLDEAKEKQAKVQERVEQLAKVNDKGELTAEAIAALGGTIKVDGQFVTVDFTDEYTMEALKGYTVNVIIYSSITDVNALTIDHFTKGIDNTATVQFNHDPSDNLTKKTNKVTVVPPKNETPPPPATPDKPKGDLPTPPTPPTEPTPPPSSGPILPKTGTNENGVYAIVGIILGALTFVLRKRKDNDSL